MVGKWHLALFLAELNDKMKLTLTFYGPRKSTSRSYKFNFCSKNWGENLAKLSHSSSLELGGELFLTSVSFAREFYGA